MNRCVVISRADTHARNLTCPHPVFRKSVSRHESLHTKSCPKILQDLREIFHFHTCKFEIHRVEVAPLEGDSAPPPNSVQTRYQICLPPARHIESAPCLAFTQKVGSANSCVDVRVNVDVAFLRSRLRVCDARKSCSAKD